MGASLVGATPGSQQPSDSYYDDEQNHELKKYSKQLDDRLDASVIAIKNLDTSIKEEMVQKIESLLSSSEVSTSQFTAAVGY